MFFVVLCADDTFKLCLLGHLLCDIDEESDTDQTKLHCLTVTFYKWFAKVFCC